MVTIGAPTPVRPRVTLAGLLAERDASIAARPRTLALAGLRAKRALRSVSSASARAVLFALALLATLAQRHALVLGGLSAFTYAAWGYGQTAGLVALGISLFFLELRRH
jgi:hypothetical protein